MYGTFLYHILFNTSEYWFVLDHASNGDNYWFITEENISLIGGQCYLYNTTKIPPYLVAFLECHFTHEKTNIIYGQEMFSPDYTLVSIGSYQIQ